MRVHQIEMKSDIEPSLPFAEKGLATFKVNVGAKCGHDCLYCSTGASNRRHHSFKAVGESAFGTGYSIVDPKTAERVAVAARSKRKQGLIQLCTTVDAWSP